MHLQQTRAQTRVSLLIRALVTATAILTALPAVALGEGTSAPPAPANDTLANAQVIHTLPATITGTTVGASTEGGEHESACNGPTSHSVWYSLRLSSAHRVAIDLTAAGALDATVDVFHAVRSQLVSAGCAGTEAKGKTSLSFTASKNGLYDIRIAARQNSQLAGFTLEVFLPTPAVQPPGTPSRPPASPARSIPSRTSTRPTPCRCMQA